MRGREGGGLGEEDEEVDYLRLVTTISWLPALGVHLAYHTAPILCSNDACCRCRGMQIKSRSRLA